jgi:rhodanese-related sulfurtransferase
MTTINKSRKIVLLIGGLAILTAAIIGATYVYLNADNKSISDTAKKVGLQENNDNKYKDIEPADAYKLINDNPSIIIIDVSPRFEKGHLPKALNYYIGDGSLDKAIPSLDKNKTYLVYCHVDSASIPGAQKLIDAGIKDVYRLKGNYGPWLEGGYPIEISLKALGNKSGSAVAIRSYIDGKYSHNVTMNTANPTSGKFYEGWLVKGTDFFSTGKLTQNGESYVLTYESDNDRRDYKNVVITEETTANGLDNKPETHIFEAEFE